MSSKENRAIFKFSEEDKFLFNCLDRVVAELQREFKDYSKEFIVNALRMNTLNISQVYEFLRKPYNSNTESKSFLNLEILFNSSDDHVIKFMKNTNFYKELVDSKGLALVEEREYFLG